MERRSEIYITNGRIRNILKQEFPPLEYYIRVLIEQMRSHIQYNRLNSKIMNQYFVYALDLPDRNREIKYDMKNGRDTTYNVFDKILPGIMKDYKGRSLENFNSKSYEYIRNY